MLLATYETCVLSNIMSTLNGSCLLQEVITFSVHSQVLYSNTTPDKADKSAKVEKCAKCNKNVVEDCTACDWCSNWEHRSCTNISLEVVEVLAW